MKILYFIIIFCSFSLIASSEMFSSKVKDQDFIVVYKDKLAFARYSKVENSSSLDNIANINNSNLNKELNNIQANQKQNIGQKSQSNQTNNQGIPLSDAYFKYYYKKLQDGIFELENGAILKVQNGDIQLIRNKKYAGYDAFFQETKNKCNSLKFDFIYNTFILEQPFFGNFYQIYIPYYFDSVLLFLIYNQKTGKINSLITSSSKDFSCVYNKKFYNYNIIKNFAKNGEEKLEEIKTETRQKENKKNINNKAKEMEELIFDESSKERIQLERNFKIAFKSLCVSKDINVIREYDNKEDIFDDINTFDIKTLSFYRQNKKNKGIIKSSYKNNLFEIEDCTIITLYDKKLMETFQWLRL